MAAIATTTGAPSAKGSRRKWLWALLVLPVGLGFASWWFTAPLDIPPPGADVIVSSPTNDEVTRVEPRPSLEWPEQKLEGDAAKKLLLDIVTDASRRIDQFQGYTATFKKLERINGKLVPEQTLAMKVRHNSFAVYFKFLAPKAGKEVVYAEGKNDNMVIAHNGDWTRRLVPRLRLEPNGKVALADSRHPITEAGLSNLAHKLLAFRKLDLEDSDAVTILDRITEPDGHLWLRAVHLHTHKSPARPYTRVEVLFDPKTLIPMQISSWEWPESSGNGELLLAERYRYEDLVIDPILTALDFDPSNPKYEFMRF